MSEVWKPVVGHEGDYMVSDQGRVKRLAGLGRNGRAIAEKILRLTPTGDGHLQVGIHGRLQTVHSLVLIAFVGPRPFPKAQGRHLNDDPSDNWLSNLAWGTAKDNAADRERNGSARRDPVRAARIAAKLGALLAVGPVTYKDMAGVASEFGVSVKTVQRSMSKIRNSPDSTVPIS